MQKMVGNFQEFEEVSCTFCLEQQLGKVYLKAGYLRFVVAHILTSEVTKRRWGELASWPRRPYIEFLLSTSIKVNLKHSLIVL